MTRQANKSRWAVSILMVGLSGLLACAPGDNSTGLDVDLYTAAGHESLLEAGGGIDELEVVVIDLSKQIEQPATDLQVAAGEGTLAGIPLGGEYQMFVRGFSNDTPTQPKVFGGSARFGVKAGDDGAISIQIGPSDCVGLNQSSKNRAPDGTDDLGLSRVGMSMTALPDGRVLIAGGAEIDGQGNLVRILDSIEVYDPTKGQFLPFQDRLRVPRAHHSATLLASGKVLLVGGITGLNGAGYQRTSSATLVDLNDFSHLITAVPDAFGQTGGRYGHQAHLLYDAQNTVLISGGVTEDGRYSDTAFRFFPNEAGGVFTQQGSMWAPRAWHAQATLRRGSELAAVSGGLVSVFDDDGNRLEDKIDNRVEIFTINPGQRGCVTENLVPGPDLGCFIRPQGRVLGEPRWGHAGLAIDNGRQVLFVGGYTAIDRSDYAQSFELLDESLTVQSEGVGSLAQGRGEFSATALSDGSVILLGGRRGDSPVSASTRLRPHRIDEGGGSKIIGFNAVSLVEGCELSEPRYGHQAVLMSTGTVLLSGGITGRAGAPVASRRGEIFFPQVNNVSTLYPDL